MVNIIEARLGLLVKWRAAGKTVKQSVNRSSPWKINKNYDRLVKGKDENKEGKLQLSS